ncbi:TetR/AcrR family transcriptional regulator [Winogradskya humida]|uniref:TetR family transcriptional regulator n=1 Tax=Winogradskya humida TaxID=113566 RepID=A0ABQ3ZMS5_9ACTN|nr:TetR/AcrR family transcriptional regulator [Actinoplanes humidus]GIE19890.1 TetR family transcriptional regulator [Actinoplanes humidus]
MTTITPDLRAAMIAAAEQQLVVSKDGDIATRAVCEAVGVTQPVLYRLFGDKNGLLDALADDGLRRYAEQKARMPQTGDPVADLRAGWDDHMAFARDNPALYQLMFAPRPRSHAQARGKIMELLEANLLRCSAVGALRIAPPLAAQLILPANVGLALSLIAQPSLFADPGLSHRMRDAVFASVLSSSPSQLSSSPSQLSSSSRQEDDSQVKDDSRVRPVAMQLRSQLAISGTDALEPVETALLDRWLERLTQS